MNFDGFEIEISSVKISDYLLNAEHVDGWSKAKFFRSHNLNLEQQVKALLLDILLSNGISEIIEPPFGKKYIVEGKISEDDSAKIRTVWIVLTGEKICKFVTAYPI